MKWIFGLVLFFGLIGCAWTPEDKSWEGIVVKKYNYDIPMICIKLVQNGKLNTKDVYSINYIDPVLMRKWEKSTWIVATYSVLYNKFTYKTWITNLDITN